jgi:hypothetical protein
LQAGTLDGDKEERLMGTWGPGNFENDAALDMVEDVLKAATTEVEGFCASKSASVEGLDEVLAGVAIHLALHEHCSASAPDLTVATKLLEKALRIYDEGIDSLKPKGDFKAQRRAAIVATLGRYEKAARDSG